MILLLHTTHYYTTHYRVMLCFYSQGLFKGAGTILKPQGVLLTYGVYYNAVTSTLLTISST